MNNKKKEQEQIQQDELEKAIREAQKRGSLNKSDKTKKCIRCKKEKALKDFYNCSRNDDGKDNVCIECTKKRREENRIKKMEKEN